MPRQSRTFRIFVSSTFSDLKEERNALQRNVFPKLRELCMRHGCRFQAIDLRWGIREEASLDQQTMRICLEEIARCQRVTPRPNFIVQLGDRYGWRPLPYEIPADEFDEIMKRLDNDEKALLENWYWRDDNAVPPVYDLQPRTGPYKEWDNWEAVERRIRSILLGAIADMRLSEEARSKYIASATEQEIIRGALNVQDAHEHVFCFFRKIDKLPQDESAKYFVDLNDNGKPDEEAAALLIDLKKRLKTAVPNNIFEYEAEWKDDAPTTDHINQLCADVLNSLTRVIRAQIAEIKEKNPLEQEIDDHEEFGKERSKFFTGRAEILQTIAEYIDGSDPNPLVIFGQSGTGKTAVMAKAVEQAQVMHPNACVIFRYIGATPGASDGRSLLESLCREISRTYRNHELDIPAEYGELAQVFLRSLFLATEARPLILFLDALDQFTESDRARNFAWLPNILSPNVRVMVSTLPDATLTNLENNAPKSKRVELQRMPLNETTQLLNRWLTGVSRKLQPRQRQDVAQNLEASGLPLFLKLVFEESRRWKSYDKSKKIPGDVPGMIGLLLQRMSLDVNHGKMIVGRALGCLAASRRGLSEDELLDILSDDEDLLQDVRKRPEHKLPEGERQKERLPVVVWSRLYSDLEPYLRTVHSDGALLMSFYHGQFRLVVEETYLSNDSQQSLTHHKIATHFRRAADPSGDRSWTVMCPRTLNELPYHLYQYGIASKDCQPLFDVVEDARFKKLQFEYFGVPDPLTRDIGYAIDLAITRIDPVGIIHYALMRSRLPRKFYRSYLYRLALLAPEKPELALAVVRLLPAPELRRLAMVFLAWLLSQDDRKSAFVKEILAMAVTIPVPAAVANLPLLMEMMLKLYQRGFTRSIELAEAIPECPVAQFYNNAWKGSEGSAREIASKITCHLHRAEKSEIQEFASIQEGLARLGAHMQGINSQRKMAAFEEQLADRFGPSGAASAYFLLATAQIHSGRQSNAAYLINRGLYVASATPKYAIRTLAALAEGCGRTGEEDLATEHMARIHTLLAGLRRALVKTEKEEWFLEDAQAELGISMERLSPAWRPRRVNEMFEAGLAQRSSTSRGDRLAVSQLMTNARQLLAEGHSSAVLPILTQICTRLEGGEVVDHPDAAAITVFAMAHVCDDRGIMSRSIALLQNENLRPQSLFSAGQLGAELRSLLEVLVSSAIPHVATVAQCLGLCNRRETLFEFARHASLAGADMAILDAIMAEIVRDPALTSDHLRTISSEVTSDFRHFVIAQGLGMYYYPVAMLAAMWGGLVLGAAGLASALVSFPVVITGVLILIGGLAGGLSDLVLWHIVRLWEKPEKSKRWWCEAGTLACFLVTLALFRWLPEVPRDAPLFTGMAVPLVSAAGPFVLLRRSGWLFTLPKFRTIAGGSAVATFGALILGMIAFRIENGEFLTHLLQGIFLGAAGFMAVALNILPKHIAVRRFYGTKGSLEEPDTDR